MTQLSLESGFLPEQSQERQSFLGAAYPRAYAWVLTVAVLDVVVTSLVLGTGGKETNALARWAIDQAGVAGMVAVKATTLTLVLLICQYLARHRPIAGLRIVGFALAANSLAVVFGLIYLTEYSIVLLQWMGTQ